MKFSNEHYAMLKGMIEQGLKNNNITPLQIEEKYKDHSVTRKVWDVYWMACKNVLFNEVYRPAFEQYNDSHIESALKKIWKELNECPVS